jgi:ABC-2 type transport system ATP-binding protein
MMNAIEVADVHKVYRSKAGMDAHALNGVSFKVPQGMIYGLLGPNGAGKSTMVRILSTITSPTSGHASILGCDVVRQGLAARGKMAVVLQHTASENLLTVRDNLMIYAYLHGVGSAAAQTRANALIEEFELGAILRTTVQELSEGTKRRIQVAKIFMLDSPLMILDEATTGMDPMMRRRVLDRLRAEARKGRTILLTTQVLSEAEELCDEIMILNKGRTMASGTLQDLRALSTQMFRVNLTFADGADDLDRRLRSLNPSELQVNGRSAEMVFQGEEASLLGKLADISRDTPIAQFEVRGPTLEEIFLTLVEEAK